SRHEVTVRFQDGTQIQRTLLIAGGGLVRLRLPIIGAEQPEQADQTGRAHKVTAVAFSPDGMRVLTGSWDTTAVLWDVATGAKLRTFRGHARGITSLALSPDGKRVLTSAGGEALLWDADSGQKLCTFGESAQPLAIGPVAFTPDPHQVLIGGVLWDTRS